MNILQISPQIPFPPNDGGRIGIHGILTSLSKMGHTIHFFTYSKNWDIGQGELEIKPFAKPYIIQYNPKHTLIGAFFNLFSVIPYNIAKFQNRELIKKIKGVLATHPIDVVHIDHLHMGWAVHWFKKHTKIPVILRQHNLEMRIMTRFAERESNWFIRQYANLQVRKFRQFEPQLCGIFDSVAMISETDEDELRKHNPNVNSLTIPSGISSELLERPLKRPVGKKVAHIGAMDWAPNKDSLNSFIANQLPGLVQVIPELQLIGIGKGTEQIEVPDNLKKHVALKGFVQDIWQELDECVAVIVPLRIGGGIRIKILEMMAGGVPVIASPIGLEGIHAVSGESVFVAKSDEDWLRYIGILTDEEDARMSMIQNAREFIRQNHTWEHVGKQFESLYLSLIKR